MPSSLSLSSVFTSVFLSTVAVTARCPFGVATTGNFTLGFGLRAVLEPPGNTQVKLVCTLLSSLCVSGWLFFGLGRLAGEREYDRDRRREERRRLRRGECDRERLLEWERERAPELGLRRSWE